MTVWLITLAIALGGLAALWRVTWRPPRLRRALGVTLILAIASGLVSAGYELSALAQLAVGATPFFLVFWWQRGLAREVREADPALATRVARRRLNPLTALEAAKLLAERGHAKVAAEVVVEAVRAGMQPEARVMAVELLARLRLELGELAIARAVLKSVDRPRPDKIAERQLLLVEALICCAEGQAKDGLELISSVDSDEGHFWRQVVAAHERCEVNDPSGAAAIVQGLRRRHPARWLVRAARLPGPARELFSGG